MEALEDIQDFIGDEAGVAIFGKAFIAAQSAPLSVRYATGWAALEKAGYKADQTGVWKFVPARAIYQNDDSTSKMPFPVDFYMMGRLRPDQTPRFLGALTNPELLPIATIPFADLTAIQNRISTEKIDSLLNETDTEKPAGVVALFEGKHFIIDGHHRIVARWLCGEDTVRVRLINLMPLSNAMKSLEGDSSEPFTFSQEVRKIDEELRMVYGWASVVEENGRPVVDFQGHMITPGELVTAAHRFISSHRTAKAMHKGEVIGEFVESLVFTAEVQKALNVNFNKIGWFVGLHVTNEKIWKAVKAGELRMFSIGGQGNLIDKDL